MRLGGVVLALVVVGGVFAQNRSGFVSSGPIVRPGGSVLFPAGTSAFPGVQRTTGSVLFPGGGGPQIGVPSAIRNLNFPGVKSRFNNRNNAVIVPVPVYVGSGYSDPSGGYAPGYDPAQALPPQGPAPGPQQQQPNVIVVYPPAGAPDMFSGSGSAQVPYGYGPGQPAMAYPPQEQPPVQEDTSAEQPHYLIAFKDHSIYSAIAYWVDGDTLHYFTTGNTHNQASVSLIDREMTARLNKGSGWEIKLPPAK